MIFFLANLSQYFRSYRNAALRAKLSTCNHCLSTAILAIVVSTTGLSSAAIAASDSHELEVTDRDSNTLSKLELINAYQERIATLELEIRNESERRTTILHQLDQIINEASALKDENRNIIDSALPLNSSLRQLHTEIEVLEQDIKQNHNLLEKMQDTLNSQPELSLWHAALGKPEINKRQKLLATQGYLLHTTRNHVEKLESMRNLLNERYNAMLDYDQTVKNSIHDTEIQFAKVTEKRQHLEQQLTEISAQIVVRQDRSLVLTDRLKQMQTNPSSLHFANLKTKLKDPVEGQIVRKFSEPKAKGLLKWKGILVEAPLGLPFTSVSDGLVVFADQLQGLGNVAIVDHGDGYMTLYGMAELLLVEQHQFILAGDPVGTVGEPVGADVSALYFEVRHNADALNPEDWLEMHQITQKNKLQRLFSESK